MWAKRQPGTLRQTWKVTRLRERERERRERKRVELGLYKPSTVAAALPPKRQITEWRTSNPAVAADENKKHDYPAGMNGGFLKRA
jgi:hypothetical protein